MPAWRAWSINCSSRKWARSPPSEAMTAESASSHSRVSRASASLAAVPKLFSGSADIVSPVFALFDKVSHMLPDNPPMERADPAPTPPRSTRTWAERVFGHWWRRQSAARQDPYATLGALLSVLLFLAAIVSAFWYLRNEEFDREQEAVRRDTEVAQQQVRLRLIENHEQLTRMARELVGRTLDHDTFLVQAAAFTLEHPEVSNLIWLSDQRVRIGGYSGTTFPPETGISGVDTPASLPVE